MMTIPELVGISDLRLRQSEVLNRLRAGRPIVLTQHTQPVAVLVSPDLWNQLVERLEDLEDALEVREMRAHGEPLVDYDDYVTSRADRV